MAAPTQVTPPTDLTVHQPRVQRLVAILTSTDHKVIGNLYLGTSFGFFLIGGLLVMGIRAELTHPGLRGNAARYADYPARFTALILAISTLPFVWNIYITARHGEKVDVDDPWGYGNSLEWATPCPPPRHNFLAIPRIRSERPAFDLHYPLKTEEQQGNPDSVSDGAG